MGCRIFYSVLHTWMVQVLLSASRLSPESLAEKCSSLEKLAVPSLLSWWDLLTEKWYSWANTHFTLLRAKNSISNKGLPSNHAVIVVNAPDSIHKVWCCWNTFKFLLFFLSLSYIICVGILQSLIFFNCCYNSYNSFFCNFLNPTGTAVAILTKSFVWGNLKWICNC